MLCETCGLDKKSKYIQSCKDNTTIEFPDGTTEMAVRHEGEEKCASCNVVPNGFHHPGCGIERCPKCGGQLISCECWGDEEDEYKI